MSGTSNDNVSTTYRFIVHLCHFLKWLFNFIWISILVALVVNIISTWLTTKNFDPTGTPLGWIFQNLLSAILSGLCLMLFTILVLLVCFFIEHNPSWFYNLEEKQRSKLRHLFATHIEHEIERISIQEDWKDYHYTDLEAEVEVQGRQKVPRISFFSRNHSGPRRENSLTEALRKSLEKVILVEGEPGSGKSVALRHVALEIIKQAKKEKSTISILPIYVNLKLLERENGEEINRDLIESFIMKTLMRSNDRDVQIFLNDQFQNGMRDGTFFFLFDSFDEIPEILNSVEADDKVNDYGKAIDDFLHGTNQCRGIIASRFYRGPTHLGWVHFRILPLSEDRQLELISRTNLAFEAKLVVGQIGNANQTIRSMASNPFFLALLCRHLEKGYLFPENVHVVFETYINQRFADDEKYLQKYFQLDITQVRRTTEAIAYSMTASQNLGLNPTRDNLQQALIKLGLNTSDPLEKILDALEYMKLARPDIAANTNLSKSFTFSHRRFQEYFATCFVLREPRRVQPKQLLTQGSWRETAVVLFQTQPVERLRPLMRQAERFLEGYCAGIPDLIDDPLEYILAQDSNLSAKRQYSISRFPWPSGLFHLLSLLQEGCVSRLTLLSTTVRTDIDKLLLSATVARTRDNKKWALEVAGIASEATLEYLLNSAFSSDSQWLKEVAFRQVARLSQIPSTIATGIRKALLYLAADNRLQKERQTNETYLKRLSQGEDFLSHMRLLLWIPLINFVSLLISSFIFIPFLFHIFIISNQSSLNNWVNDIVISVITFLFLLLIHFNFHRTLKVSLILSISSDNLEDPWDLLHFMFEVMLSLCCFAFFAILIVDFIGSLFFGYSISDTIFLIFLITYSLSFAPLAAWATYFGKYTKIYLWPFIPIWPLIYLLQHLPSAFRSLLSMSFYKELVRELTKAILFMIVLMLAFILTVTIATFALALIIDLTGSLVSSFVSRFLYSYITYLYKLSVQHLFLVFLIFSSFPLLLMIEAIYKKLTDEIRYRAWTRNLQRQINIEELYKIFEEHHRLKEAARRIIRTLREQHLLQGTQETVKSLEEVALKIERRRRQRDFKSKRNRKDRSFFNLMIEIQYIKIIKLFIFLARRKIKGVKLRKSISKICKKDNFTGKELLLRSTDSTIIDDLYIILNELRTSMNKF